MKWLLIVGIVLFAGWYILAPLLTPTAMKEQQSQRAKPRRGTRQNRPDLTVINGTGRVVDEEAE